TFCLDRGTGKILWRQPAPAAKIEKVHQMNSPATPTPASDGERVYVFFGSYGLLCYDRQGETKWQKPLVIPNLFWGSATSPVVAGDLVLLNGTQGGKLTLTAFERQTGK